MRDSNGPKRHSFSALCPIERGHSSPLFRCVSERPSTLHAIGIGDCRRSLLCLHEQRSFIEHLHSQTIAPIKRNPERHTSASILLCLETGGYHSRIFPVNRSIPRETDYQSMNVASELVVIPRTQLGQTGLILKVDMEHDRLMKSSDLKLVTTVFKLNTRRTDDRVHRYHRSEGKRRRKNIHLKQLAWCSAFKLIKCIRSNVPSQTT